MESINYIKTLFSNKEQVPPWMADIMTLASDFQLDLDPVYEILAKTVKRYPDIVDNEYLYDRAWASMKHLLMSI